VTIFDVNAQRKEKRREENLNSKRALKLRVRKFNKVCLQAVLIKICNQNIKFHGQLQ
jgi:hypothetical protein